MTARRRAAAAAWRLAALGGSLAALGAALAANALHVEDFVRYCLSPGGSLPRLTVVAGFQMALLGVTVFLLLGLGRGAWVFFRQWLDAARLVRALRRGRAPLPPPAAAAAAGAGLAGRVDLVRDGRPIAFTYGFLRPRVLVSSGLVEALSASELAAVLNHERYHALARDPFRVALARAVAAVFPGCAPVRDLVARFLLTKELAADEYAVERCGGPDRVVGALVRLLETGRLGRLTLGAAAGGADEAAERLRRLLAYPAPLPPEAADPGRRVQRAAALLSSLALLFAAAALSLPDGAACAAGAWLGFR